MSLMVSISGIRGIVGDSLIPETIVQYTSAFADYCKCGKIVIGRDGRLTGKIVGNIVSSTLLSKGCDVIALGITPTPTIQIAVEHLHASGGISITASHNPIEWNGLKFVGPSGLFLDQEENDRFWEIARGNARRYASWNTVGRHLADETYLYQHIDMALHLPYLQIDRIREKKFRVVVDCINAAGGMIVPQLLKEMGCDVVEMNCEVSGIFSRTPEPVPENLKDLCKRVIAEGADLGIAVDPDVDRLVLITEKGEPFGEEYTVTTIVQFILERLSHSKGGSVPTVVVNLSTTRAVEDVAARFGARVLRTPVGEINVAKRMREVGAVVGGEGSGGIILPALHYGRDAIVGIVLILQQLADFGGKLSELRAGLPQYNIVKERVKLAADHPPDLLNVLRQRAANGAAVNTDDGIKFDFEDSWVHLRKSNTEPLLRIIAEAPTEERAKELVRTFTDMIDEMRDA